MDFKKEELVKSPLNYTGGKFKLLPQILPLFPNKIDTFIDLFGGGFNVGINVKANQIIYNDIEKHIVELLNYFKNNEGNVIIKQIDSLIDKYGLTRTDKYGYEYYGCNSSEGVSRINKKPYLKLREDYNKNKTPLLFFTTIIFAFSNQIRFNSKGEFNVSVNKRDFNNNIKNNLIRFLNKMKEIEVFFYNEDFTKLKINTLSQNDFVYCDPPYLITCANYNENGGWDENKEIELLNLLNSLNYKGVKFALSNVLENKGKTNNILKDWAKDYNIHYLNNSYGNCNYHTKDKSNNSTTEVLITNY